MSRSPGAGVGVGVGVFVTTASGVFGLSTGATKLARSLMDDAKLVRIDAFYVAPDGFADLTLGSSGYAIYQFRSPKRSERGSVPIGVALQCKITVMVGPQQGVMVVPVEDHNCNDPILGAPKCSPKEVWTLAKDKGAPENAVAQLAYFQNEGKHKWLVMVASSFSQFFDDDCH